VEEAKKKLPPTKIDILVNRVDFGDFLIVIYEYMHIYNVICLKRNPAGAHPLLARALHMHRHAHHHTKGIDHHGRRLLQ
jgi:hypothetical protein